MKKISLLLIFATLAIISCSKAKTSNISTNNPTSSPQNAAVNSAPNISISNQNSVSATKSEVNSEMLKQIESQQLETADPRKVTKQKAANSNQSPKQTAPAGRQTW
jgi:hypothetical protein